MFLLKVTNKGDFLFGAATYYEYDNERTMLDAARALAAKGVEVVVFKPFKRFEKPKPEVVELDV